MLQLSKVEIDIEIFFFICRKLDLDDVDKEKSTLKEYLSNTGKEKAKVKEIYTVLN